MVKGKDYGQQTKYIYGCMDETGHFDLQQNSCTLLGGKGGTGAVEQLNSVKSMLSI